MIEVNRLICGDATKEMMNIPDSSVDLIIADPPYNLGKNYGNNRDARTKNEYEAFTHAWLSQAVRLLKPTGSIYVFMGVRFISKLFSMLEDDFAYISMAGLLGITHKEWDGRRVSLQGMKTFCTSTRGRNTLLILMMCGYLKNIIVKETTWPGQILGMCGNFLMCIIVVLKEKIIRPRSQKH